MKAWEHIINAAMLGTDKPMPGNTDVAEEVRAIFNQIDDNTISDKEAKFLQKAAVVYNYRQCGFTPFQRQDLPPNKADDETKPYCSANAARVLNSILSEDCIPLLQLWMKLCNNYNQLLLPDVLPVVLDKAQKDTTLQPLIIACCGNRGAWLSGLNPAWNYFTTLPDEELWQTGKPEERVKALQKARQQDPDKAREWLQQTWAQENAASKLELLKTLRVNNTAADLPWLESLLAEKGQKVKDEAMNLLKLFPGSTTIQQYEALLAQSVTLKKEKALLGMMTKISIPIKLPAVVDERIFASGIEKLAGQKATMNDESYIIYQLISAVPPAFWEKQFEATPAQVVEYFEKYAPDMVPAIEMAVSRFKEKNWVQLFVNQNRFYIDFLAMMPAAEQEKYLLKFIDQDARNIIHAALSSDEEWGLEFTRAALRFMASNPYEYNRGFYNKNIGLIPVGILPQLDKYSAKDPNMQSSWEKTRDHLTKLLSLKQQTLQAFTA
jgi:hypothetical protein